jgi:hypothetical protein
MLFFARLCSSITTYQPIIIKKTYISMKINKEMSLLRFEPMKFWFKTSFTGGPVDQENKLWSPKIYLAAHSRKPFVDIWYGLREK